MCCPPPFQTTRVRVFRKALQLKDNMFAISTGHLDTEVSGLQKDEATQMAEVPKGIPDHAQLSNHSKLEAEAEERTYRS